MDLPTILEFLQDGVDKGLDLSGIKVQIATLSAILQRTLQNYLLISRFWKALALSRPAPRGQFSWGGWDWRFLEERGSGLSRATAGLGSQLPVQHLGTPSALLGKVEAQMPAFRYLGRVMWKCPGPPCSVVASVELKAGPDDGWQNFQQGQALLLDPRLPVTATGCESEQIM